MATPDWITSIYERPTEGPTEAEAPAEETVGDRGLLQGDRNAPTPASATLATAEAKPEDGKAKAPMHLKGEFSPQLPEDIQDERQLIRQKELNFAEAQSYTRLNTGRALSQTKAMAQEIAMEDHLEMERLNKEHYARWEAENTQFRADIDAARQLRVNPNNYFQNIGRSGRVSSVLAAAASQMAAGAGNPNIAWARIKATIDQDINAQKSNIELEFGGIKAAQGQQDREQQLLEKYYGFEEKSRAVAFTALEAQIGVIMQRSANEMEYQGYQMIRDRARAEAIDASAAALAKNATLYLDQPTHTAYQNLIAAKKWKQAQAMLQAAYQQAEGSAQAVDTSIQSFDQYGQPVTFDDPAVAPLGEVVEGPQPAVEPAAQPAAARVARKRPAAEAGPSPEEQRVIDTAADAQADIAADAAADRRPLTPEEAAMEHKLGGPAGVPEGIAADAGTVEAREAAAEAEKQAAAQEKELRTKAAAAQVEQGIRQRMGDSIKTSYRHEELKRLNMKPQGFNTFLEARDMLLDPTNPEINVFPSYEDAREGRKYDQRTGARAAYEQKRPELYEQDTFLEHEGTKTKPRWIEQNYVETAWGNLKLSRTSTFRHDTATRDEFRKKVNDDFLRAQDIRRQSESIRKYGTGSIMGLQVGKDGITWVGTDGAEEMNERLAGQIGLGIRAMKQLDPSGRLTDKDIEVGIQFMTALVNKPSIKVWETLSSIYRNVTGQDPTKSAVRKSLTRVLGATASKLSDAIAVQHVGDIVMNYDQHNKFAKDRQDVDKWLRTEEKD
jgi:hypothetical protein